MHKDSESSRAVTGVLRRVADAITNLAHENSSIKTLVRLVSSINRYLLSSVDDLIWTC